MENTALANNAVKDVEMAEYIDEYDNEELSEELIADLNLALEQIERGECITEDELKEKYSKKYGIKF